MPDNYSARHFRPAGQTPDSGGLQEGRQSERFARPQGEDAQYQNPQAASQHQRAQQADDWEQYRPNPDASRMDSSYHTPQPPKKKTGRVVGIVIGVILAVVLVGGGTMGFMLYKSAMTVKDRAGAVMDQAGVLKDALMNGDTDTLDTAVGEVAEGIAFIDNEVHGGLWDAATLIPVVGEDIKSMQKLGDAASELSDGALVPIASSLSGMKLSELIQDGAINVQLVTALSTAVSEAAPVISDSAAVIASLPEPHIPQLKSILGKVQEPAVQAKGLISEIEPMLKLLPQMLGANGPRNYLIIAQNNSELRSTGGLPGSWGVMNITDGRIELGDFFTILHEQGLNVSATPEEISLICSSIHTDPAQVNFSPNFVRVGELSREYWAQMGHGDVDGVIAIDPVFLQRLLGLAGGYTAANGLEINGETAAQALLSDAYWLYGNDGDSQDEFFSSVASNAFQQIMGNLGSIDFVELIDVFTKSAEDGRILAWMLNPEEEAVLENIGVSGSMSTDTAKPELGVYFNDDTISKISWYAKTDTQIGDGVKNPDGTTTYSVTTTVANTLDYATAEAAPLYISGSNEKKRDVTDMLLYVMLFAPAGGSISDLTFSDGAIVGDLPTIEGDVYGLHMISNHIHLLGGETVTITYNVTTAADAVEPLSLRTTPLAQEVSVQ